MPKCSQCDRPAIYVIPAEGGQIPLCLQCGALHQSIIDRQIAALQRQADEALDQMEVVTGVRLPRRRPPTPVILSGSTFHNITIKDSNVGVVNSGHLTQVDTAVSVIAGQGDQPLADAIKKLTESVMGSEKMNEANKNEAVEILSLLSSEATTPTAQRRTAVARPLLARLRDVLSSGADIVVIAQALVPVIAGAFGTH